MAIEDWGTLKCKDYYIIKLRFYASPHYMKLMRRNHPRNIIDWVKENVDIPNKVIKKTCIGIISLKPDTWRREMYQTEEELLERISEN